MHGMRQHMDLRVAPRDERTVHPDIAVTIIIGLVCHSLFLSCTFERFTGILR